MSLLNLSVDLSLAVGLVIAAVGIIVLTRIGLLPKKSVPYVVLAVGGAFGIAWFKKRQADGLRARLRAEEDRLKALEGRLSAAAKDLGAADARLEATRLEVDARRAAIQESIVDLEASHGERLQEISGLSGEALDAEMTALLARLEGGS